MKRSISLLVAIVMVFTIITPTIAASAEDIIGVSAAYNVRTETQADNSSGGFFQAIIDFFRSLFY